MAFQYRIIKPTPGLATVVERFWTLGNPGDEAHDVIVLPDGRVDIFFTQSALEPFQAVLLGLGTLPERNTILPGTTIFAVSLTLPGVEQLLQTNVAGLLNHGSYLPQQFWNIQADDLNDFNAFCDKVSAVMLPLVDPEYDERKRRLFAMIYESQGAASVKQLAEHAFWSSRQINRYFQEHFGLSLKAYCNILRFRAAFPQIKNGNFFPEEHFADQAHFIKEVKHFSGVTPKELFKNKNDRFIQFSAWTGE